MYDIVIMLIQIIVGDVGWLFEFYGISTFVDLLTPKTFLFQDI